VGVPEALAGSFAPGGLARQPSNRAAWQECLASNDRYGVALWIFMSQLPSAMTHEDLASWVGKSFHYCSLLLARTRCCWRRATLLRSQPAVAQNRSELRSPLLCPVGGANRGDIQGIKGADGRARGAGRRRRGRQSLRRYSRISGRRWSTTGLRNGTSSDAGKAHAQRPALASCQPDTVTRRRGRPGRAGAGRQAG